MMEITGELMPEYQMSDENDYSPSETAYEPEEYHNYPDSVDLE
jgi:hypothetical protein